jgi:hypothetical protein
MLLGILATAAWARPLKRPLHFSFFPEAALNLDGVGLEPWEAPLLTKGTPSTLSRGGILPGG